VRLIGRMDSPGVDQIELRFTAGVVASGRQAVIDLTGVSFLASMGIRMLITGAKALQNKGAGMALFGATPDVQNVLDTVSLDQIIPVAETEAGALERLKG
jgi:anti-anti-sigma factor